MINKSDSISKLCVSLMKFNCEVGSISKDKKNPFFKSDYVTLDKLIIETRPILSKYGLSVMQFPVDKDGMVGVQTLLLHESGEFIEGNEFYLKPAKNDPQAYGSAVTYARRYTYQAILNLNTGDDDDGNYATHGSNEKPNSSNQSSKLTDGQLKRLFAIATSVGVTMLQVKAGALRDYKVKNLEDLTKNQYDELVAKLEAKKK